MKNPRVSRRKEILKIRPEINAKETKETIEKREKTQTNKIRLKKGGGYNRQCRNTKIIRDYYEQL